MADLRHEVAQQTEGPLVRLVRFYGAGVSIGFGIGVVTLLPVALGVVPWWVLPGSVLLVIGGVLGIGSQRADEVKVSRWRGFWAAVCTVAGFVVLCLLLALF